MRYPKELKQKVLSRMMAPGNETVSVLARAFNVTEATLYAWRRVALEAGVAVPGDGRNAEQWAGPAKFAAPLQAGMPGDLDTGFDRNTPALGIDLHHVLGCQTRLGRQNQPWARPRAVVLVHLAPHRPHRETLQKAGDRNDRAQSHTLRLAVQREFGSN